MEFPWGKVIMRGCDMQAIPPQWIGTVKMDAQSKPVCGDIEESHGKDVSQSCDEVAKLRGRRGQEEVGRAPPSAVLDHHRRRSSPFR